MFYVVSWDGESVYFGSLEQCRRFVADNVSELGPLGIYAVYEDDEE